MTALNVSAHFAQDLPAAHFMAKRAGSNITSLNSSHVAMMSHPDEVAAVIMDAARALTG